MVQFNINSAVYDIYVNMLKNNASAYTYADGEIRLEWWGNPYCCSFKTYGYCQDEHAGFLYSIRRGSIKADELEGIC
jgi:hypothetical protein